MEWGLLPLHEAKKVHEKKLQKAQLQKLGSPVKAVTVKKTSTTTSKESKIASKSETKVSKKRKAAESETEDDDDFVVARTMKKRKASSWYSIIIKLGFSRKDSDNKYWLSRSRGLN